MKLSVIILSQNGQVDPKILQSLKFADEVIIWGKKEQPLQDFAKHRNEALKTAKGEWVLFVDDDEYVSSELAREIDEVIKNTSFSGFFIPRRDLIFHDLLLHGETGNISLLRLAKKSTGKFVRSVHEYWQISEAVGNLQSSLYHLKDDFVSGFIGRMNHYSPLDAQILSKENKPFSYFRLIAYPKAKFLLNYFGRLGFLDGYPGLFQAYLMSVQSLTVRVFQWEQIK